MDVRPSIVSIVPSPFYFSFWFPPNLFNDFFYQKQNVMFQESTTRMDSKEIRLVTNPKY